MSPEHTLDAAGNYDRTGASLAAGKANFGSIFDLAVASPGCDVQNVVDAGGVQVRYGTNIGWTSASDRVFTQADLTTSPAESGDHFGGAPIEASCSRWDTSPRCKATPRAGTCIWTSTAVSTRGRSTQE